MTWTPRIAGVLLAVLVSGCGESVVVRHARKGCWNDMQMAATHADSIAVLQRVAYTSLADGETRCTHLFDSLPPRKP